MNTDNNFLTVSEIQRFCMHDGPGIRTTVFLKGCPLRCAWCHNPETQMAESELLFYDSKCIFCGACVTCPSSVHAVGDTHTIDRDKCMACGACVEECPTGAIEICGTKYSIDAILSILLRDSAFYTENGGVTLSGGEPLIHKEAAVGLLKACKEAGLSTAVETCGYVDAETVKAAIPYTDLFLWDVKDTDPERHKKHTGVSNERILKNLILADSLGAKTRLRCILVNGVNTDKKHYEELARLVNSLSLCEGIELISYHAYGGTKAVFIGKTDNGRREWIPTDAQMSEAREIIRGHGAKVI